ncbi:Choline transport ATP-binding protein OpuBA [compost metagenome]
MLLDEPFQGLDSQTSENLQMECAELMIRRRSRAVMVTHNLEEAERMADHVLILRGASDHKLMRIDPENISLGEGLGDNLRTPVKPLR